MRSSHFIHVQGPIPAKCFVATSGGPDSMAALDFLHRSKRQVGALYFNHGTEHGQQAQRFVISWCREQKIPLAIGSLGTPCPTDKSLEEYWREARYSFFANLDTQIEEAYGNLNIGCSNLNKIPVITAHHLDDCVETWLFSALHGNPKLIPQQRGKYLRPFLTTDKQVLANWCHDHDVPYLTDPSNKSWDHARNQIRHNLIPEALKVHPGLKTTIRNKLL